MNTSGVVFSAIQRCLRRLAGRRFRTRPSEYPSFTRIRSELEQFATAVDTSIGGAQSFVETYPGCLWLTTRLEGRVFILVYKPNVGYAVDEARDSDSFSPAYSDILPEIMQAKDRFLKVMTAAERRHERG